MKNKTKLALLGLALVGVLAFSSCVVRSFPDRAAVEALPTPTPAATGAYTAAEFKEYFYEIALGTEFYSDVDKIRKWAEPMTLEVAGSPTAADTATLQRVCAEINEITGGKMTIRLVPGGGNAKITFAPLDQLKNHEPKILPDNWGFFHARWDENFHLSQANIVIASDKPTQAERNHLIREELTQSLGLMQDSDKYADSIFYAPWTETQNFSALDQAVIRQLYDPAVKAGMTRAELEKIIK